MLTARSRPRTRNAPHADERGETGGEKCGQDDGRPEGQPFEPAVDHPRVVPADVDGDAALERGREQRADAGERHLTQ